MLIQCISRRLDTNPFLWEHTSSPLPFNDALQHTFASMKAHLTGPHDNKLAVVASLYVGVVFFILRSLVFVFIDSMLFLRIQGVANRTVNEETPIPTTQ